MTPAKPSLAGVVRAADQGGALYEGSESGEAYSTRRRAFAYTAVITAATVLALLMGGTIDFTFTIMLYVHLITLLILLVLFAFIAATRYKPGEGALLTITLLDAIAFAFYGFMMTMQYFTLLTGLWLMIVAFVVAFGCVIVLVVGFALLAR